jgi:hypothetical protein
MPDVNDPKDAAGDPLDAIIAEYVQQVEAGQVPDREVLLAQHPKLAERLRAFFADFDRLDRQAAELRLSADPNRTTDATAPAGDELPRVRYFGDYELLEVIARGGMGVVHKARQVSLNRLVALKMILKGELATPRDVERFRAEAEAAANLDHPHIVPIYEVGEHDGQQYYAMRYIEGTALTRRPRADARQEAGLIATVARAVHFAHQHGILHRDVKPSNILVDPAGTPFVTDFGLAKRVDADRSLTEPGALVGTPRYMAPEQAAGRKDLTVAADVYSLGVVLYERLTGQTPFDRATAPEILRQVLETEPPRPSSITPGLNRDLETICLKCLEKNPSKRYSSAEALADDLERWLRGEPILARPVGQAERAWRWCRRNPAVAALSASLVLALLAGTVFSVWFGLRAEAARKDANDRAEAESRERQRAQQAEDDLELTLARSLVRPLGVIPGVTEPEAEALWDLAQDSSDRLRVRFVEEATRRPLTARQLRDRAESALIAAVGLDPIKRKRVEEHLTERLQRPDLSKEHQAHLAMAALDLGDLESANVRMITNILLQLAERKESEVSDYHIHDKLIIDNKLIECAKRLEPGEAARLLTQLLALHQKAPRSWLLPLAEVSVTVAGQLEPAEAAPLLKQFGQALSQELENATDAGHDVVTSAHALLALAERLEPAEAARLLNQTARKLTEKLTQGLVKTQGSKNVNLQHWAVVPLTQALIDVVKRLEPSDAAPPLMESARVLTHGIETPEQPSYCRKALAEGLAAVSRQLQPPEVAPVLGQAADLLILALEKSKSHEREDLAIGLAAIACQMEPSQGATVLSQALEKEKDEGAREAMAQGLAAVAGRLDRSEANSRLGQAARVLAQALDKETVAWRREYQAEGLAAVAGRWESPEARLLLRQAARTMVQAFDTETNRNAHTHLAHGLVALASHLEHAEAARMLERPARVLAQALDKERDSDSGRALDAVARLLGPAEASKLCAPAIENLRPSIARSRDMARNYFFAQKGVWLESVAASLIQTLEPEHAYVLSKKLAQDICASEEANWHPGIPSSAAAIGPVNLDAILTDAGQPALSHRAAVVATAVGLAGGRPFAVLPTLPAASEPLPCRLSTQDLVELLKMPTCFDEARRVVLKHLGNRYGRTFASHWDFVRYAKEQRLDLDFTTPPKRPERQ